MKPDLAQVLLTLGPGVRGTCPVKPTCAGQDGLVIPALTSHLVFIPGYPIFQNHIYFILIFKVLVRITV